MQKEVTLPNKQLKMLDSPTGETINVFIHMCGVVIENTPQKSDTEAYLAHEIREKIDIAKEAGKKSIVLESAEISFLESGLEKLRSQDRVNGSNWYYFVEAIRAAKHTGPELLQHGKEAKK